MPVILAALAQCVKCQELTPYQSCPRTQLAKAAGLGDEPRRIFAELSEISLVDVVLPTRSGPEIRRRCVRRPTEHQAILLDHLGLTLPRQIQS